MTKPIHTPGPAQLPTGFQLVKPDEHEGMPLFSNGDPFDTIAMVLPRKECNANARLLAAAYNAFDSAGKALGVNAVELAERMADGLIADLVEALEKAELILAKDGYDTAEFAVPVATAKGIAA
jgi:hypothetical protein